MSEQPEIAPSRAERKRKLEKVFGDVLPDQTSDDAPDPDDRERDDRAGAGRDDEWLRGEVPPHHG